MLAALVLHLALHTASAAELFPYSTRTRGYSGWNSTIQGDVEALGMGGATVAIPSSIAAAQINPAGFAMVTASVSAQILSNTIDDTHIQKSKNQYESNQWGLGVNPMPWGFGILYYSPSTESGDYISPTTGQKLYSEISVKEIRLAVAHAYFQNKLSLGMSFGLAKAVRNIGPYSYGATSFDFELGALYSFPTHFILGASFIPQNTIHESSDSYPQTDMPGFNQPIIAPAQTNIGAAWVPNRFFKAAFSLSYISSTRNTALLADQSKTVGEFAVFEPRLGASYVLAEYKNLLIEYAIGAYYEPSRIQGESNRFHGTMGLEVEPWFINTGIGFDLAPNYSNVMIAVKLNIVKSARALGIIPADPVPTYDHFFPPVTEVIADGLPEGMTKGEEKSASPANLGDIKQIITDIPKRISEKINPDKKKPAAKKKAPAKKKKSSPPADASQN